MIQKGLKVRAIYILRKDFNLALKSLKFQKGLNTHPTFSSIYVILMQIPRHPKICHLTFLSFTNRNISRSQVTMDNLEETIGLVVHYLT